MIVTETEIRVRYSETDRMGYVYYGNYAQYFEVARVENLKSLGVSYRKLEDSGIFLPVYKYEIKYFKPVFYDDLIKVKTMVKEKPGTRITFDYETFNEEGEKVNEGSTILVFVSKKDNRPCRIPEEISKRMDPHFES